MSRRGHIRPTAQHDYHIQAEKICLLPTEALAQQALDPIAPNRRPGMALGDHHAQPRRQTSIGQSQGTEAARLDAQGRGCQHLIELGSLAQPVDTRETLRVQPQF